ncbi:MULTISPECIES: protein-disulfide reductase DsbD family protein [Methylorubrum]|jgi:thiol:disulfide interchange protein/DsbC/DsbD-like thiol-disulfide interchange protein|uniref:Thiol:disulfide interchange protein n=4 Tax=Methylorubrum extorquens TaxID=408 RepID=C5AR32_METEA|nr:MULTISPECIES: protein-disulfide reductase DsbD domain-containing protein [Methylorubrum]ACS42305.1 putative thiol:disulfide interchange protein precursor [Methylorubrum extorquens AM1]MCP1544641.1 thiol:disulfide interchange protein DsbD [Methylorubrum extorquens]MCP1588012.1 thiol:disulfide interchange protein DsbD [Methylorubrum extorquens]BDL41695.1 thiol:disulfide interchange protein DsbD [Methylorubrum sp. GM97]
MLRLLLALLLTLAAGLAAPGLAGAQGAMTAVKAKDLVRARLVAESEALVPGRTVTLGLHMAMKPGWHVYWRNPGDSGLPPEMAWRLPEGFTVGPVQWPVPERIPVQTLMNFGYEGAVTLLVPLAVPESARAGETVRLSGTLSYLVCEEICIPGSAELSLDLPVAASAEPASGQAALFARARAALPEALPEAAPGSYRTTRAGDRLVLHLDRPGLAGVTEAAFFPYAEGALDNAAPQDLAVDAAGLHLTLTPGDAKVAPEALAGVLALTEDGTRKAYALGPEPAPAPTAAAAIPAAPETPPAPAEEETLTLWSAAGLALIGGLLLNLMPCVFPVLSIKVLSLVRQAGESATRVRLHGLAYTAGVLASFLGLAGLLIALKAGGAGIGWGFQLQSPVVVALLAYGLFAMGLSLSGAVHLGGGIVGLGDGLTRRAGYQGSFFTGVLATLVATPCTAPFMGAAVGFALTQSPLAALTVFASLGLGLALPFLGLTLVPQALRLLPRPGAWMDVLKGALAFPVYATVAWLVWVLAQQVGPNGLLAGLTGLVLVALAAWAWERARGAGRLGTGFGRVAAVAALAAALGLVAILDGDRAAARTALAQGEEAFTQARLDALRAEGRTVFVDMTAAWCITCQVNERTVLAREGVQAAFRGGQVVYLKGDWTNQNPEITRLLERHGRSGVPLYLVYRGQGEAQVLPQILTEGIVLAAIGQKDVAAAQ